VSRRRLARIFWIGAAAILVAAALVALAAVLRGDFTDNDGRILVTLGALLYTGGAALAGLALAERGPAGQLGRLLVVVAPGALAFIVWAVWSFALDGGGNETADKLAWSAVLALLAGLIAVTALLMARRRATLVLASSSGTLAALASGLSIVGVWTEPSGDAFVKIVAALWILTVLCYFLAPVLDRFTSVGQIRDEERILGVLDGVELVASRGHVDGIAVDAPVRGERLVLRLRA
jgi:hypothetical protein